MVGKISVIINTLNEEKNIERAIRSVSFADEIIVCDMYSDDDTAVIAKKLGAVVLFHKRAGYVEPARNFAISKASHEWILILDADEEVPEALANKLKEIIHKQGVITHVEIPRKNIIFGHWMKASMWWPDTHTRFFKAEHVVWGSKIHSKPKTEGQGLTLSSEERNAITHYHYTSVSQFLTRMDRYTSIEAKDLKASNYKFQWTDLISKPLGEFLGRFFANQGYKDGVHGLSLGLLQAFSFFTVYLKVWELEKFEEKDIKFSELNETFRKSGQDLDYWLKYANLPKNQIKRIIHKIKNKLS